MQQNGRHGRERGREAGGCQRRGPKPGARHRGEFHVSQPQPLDAPQAEVNESSSRKTPPPMRAPVTPSSAGPPASRPHAGTARSPAAQRNGGKRQYVRNDEVAKIGQRDQRHGKEEIGAEHRCQRRHEAAQAGNTTDRRPLPSRAPLSSRQRHVRDLRLDHGRFETRRSHGNGHSRAAVSVNARHPQKSSALDPPAPERQDECHSTNPAT